MIRPIKELKIAKFLNNTQTKQRRRLAMYDAYLAFKNTNQPIYDIVYRQKNTKGHTVLADFQERKPLLQRIKQKIGSIIFNKKYKPIRVKEYDSTSHDIGECLNFIKNIESNNL